MIPVNPLIKKRICGSPLSISSSSRKRDLPPHWFNYLGLFTHMVVQGFDWRAEVTFEETPNAYLITVRKLEDEK